MADPNGGAALPGMTLESFADAMFSMQNVHGKRHFTWFITTKSKIQDGLETQPIPGFEGQDHQVLKAVINEGLPQKPEEKVRQEQIN